MTKKELLEKRGDALKTQDGIWAKAEAESRGLSAEEQTQYDALDTEMDAADANLERIVKRSRRNVTQISVNNEGEQGEKTAIAKRFSVAKAIRESLRGQKIEGLEAEMQEQARSEFSSMGLSTKGHLQLPAMLMEKQEQRGITVGGNGGNIVATELNGFVGILRPDLVVERMGATVLTGLVGDIDMPEQSAKASGSWLAETGSATESNLDIAKRSISPHRLGTFSKFSRQLLIQSTPSIEQLVRADLANSIRENVEYGAIQGSGTNPVPFGVLNTTGIGSVALGTNGAAPSFASIIDLETQISNSNYTGQNMAYLTTPVMKGKLKQTQKFAGTNGMPVWDGNEMNGYPGYTTTQVPSTLTKGSNADCHAILFGDFSQMMLAQWGGTDYIIDEYTLADSGEIKIIVNSFWDIYLRYVKAFAAIKDARNV